MPRVRGHFLLLGCLRQARAARHPDPCPPPVQRAAAAAAETRARHPEEHIPSRLRCHHAPCSSPAPAIFPGARCECGVRASVCQGIVLWECVCVCVRACLNECRVCGAPALRSRPLRGKDGRTALPLASGSRASRLGPGASRARPAGRRPPEGPAASLLGWICSCSREDGFSVRSRVAADGPPGGDLWPRSIR